MVLAGRRVQVVLAGVACLAVAGCGSGATSASPHPSATSRFQRMAVAVDRLGSSYTYDLTSTCGERSLFGRFRVTVADHRVVAATPLGATRQPGLPPRAFPTLADLVEKVRHARPGGLVLATGPTGLPVVVSLDPIARAIDDEECYGVARVRTDQDENSR